MSSNTLFFPNDIKVTFSLKIL
uniref:Uncharacterized protein n=1 Tax=Rhizophora mucronata TaxID=61149 RepID=A0A2P2NJJ2_RHIMU